MHTEMISAIVLAVIGSNALWGFVQFLIARKDARKDRNGEILRAIETLSKKIDAVDKKGDERAAVNSRVRILRFADEIHGNAKSKDSWDQVMSDITEYEQYCISHPDFKNEQTKATVSILRQEYERRLAHNDFGGTNHENE